MATRADAYESKSDVDGIAALSKKLTVDLRKHIRALVRPCAVVLLSCLGFDRCVLLWLLHTPLPVQCLI